MIEPLEALGEKAAMLAKRHRKQPRESDKALDKARHLIKNFLPSSSSIKRLRPAMTNEGSTFGGDLSRSFGYLA